MMVGDMWNPSVFFMLVTIHTSFVRKRKLYKNATSILSPLGRKIAFYQQAIPA